MQRAGKGRDLPMSIAACSAAGWELSPFDFFFDFFPLLSFSEDRSNPSLSVGNRLGPASRLLTYNRRRRCTGDERGFLILGRVSSLFLLLLFGCAG